MKWFNLAPRKRATPAPSPSTQFSETPAIDPRWAHIHDDQNICGCCETTLKDLLSLAYVAPERWTGTASPQDNSAILHPDTTDILTHDLCRMADHHFIRTVMIIPLIGCADPIILGIWVEVDQACFHTYLDTMPLGQQGVMPLMFGKTANIIPGFGMGQACVMQPRDDFQRPITHIAIEEDPLYIAQIDGFDFDQLITLLAGYGHKFLSADVGHAK